MNTSHNVIKIAQQTLQIEGDSVLNGIENIGQEFESAIQLLLSCKGRIIVTGIGKSAVIANKIVATLNSTGSPAIFMHAAEAVHGDLGLLLPEDHVICISNSGNSPEIKNLIPFIKRRENKIVAIVGNTDSYLSEQADFVVNSTVKKEACSFLDAPTSSTTLQLALGDAIAVCLAQLKGFSNEDFAKSHPGGALGKRLSLTIGELSSRNEKPQVLLKTPLKELIYEISSKRMGATVVLNGGKVVGIITDGDIRRMLQEKDNVEGITAEDIMSGNPKTVNSTDLAQECFMELNKNNISQLVVVEANTYHGMVHIHDLVKEGLTD